MEVQKQGEAGGPEMHTNQELVLSGNVNTHKCPVRLAMHAVQAKESIKQVLTGIFPDP
jgi:hypothetical protein